MSIINFIFLISLCVHLIFGNEGRRIQNIELNVKRDKQNSNIYIDTERHVVYPFDPLCITVKNLNIGVIRCWSYHTSYKYNCTITNHDAMGSQIQISSVTYGMSDMWVCTFDESYRNMYIYFKVEVVGAKPPQSVIINNVLLPVRKHYEKYITEFYYKKGDIIDLKCIAQKEKYCSLQWHYTYTLHPKDIPTSFIQDKRKLKAIHNNSYIVCTSSCRNMKTTLLFVKLILGAPKKKATLKINSIQIVSTDIGYQPSAAYRTYYVNYAYFMTGDLSIVCDLFGEGYILFGCVRCDLKDQSRDLIILKILIIPKNISRIEFTVMNKINIIEKSVITFTSIGLNEYDMKVWDGFQIIAETTTAPNVHLFTTTISEDIDQDKNDKNNTTSILNIHQTAVENPDCEPECQIESPFDINIIVVVGFLIIAALIIIVSCVVFKIRKHKASSKCSSVKYGNSNVEGNTEMSVTTAPAEAVYMEIDDCREIYSYATLPLPRFIEESQNSRNDDSITNYAYANQSILSIHQGTK